MSAYAELVDVIDQLPTLLKEARQTDRLSLRAAEAVTGCSFNALSRAERGMPVSLANLAAILRWLDRRTTSLVPAGPHEHRTDNDRRGR